MHTQYAEVDSSWQRKPHGKTRQLDDNKTKFDAKVGRRNTQRNVIANWAALKVLVGSEVNPRQN